MENNQSYYKKYKKYKKKYMAIGGATSTELVGSCPSDLLELVMDKTPLTETLITNCWVNWKPPFVKYTPSTKQVETSEFNDGRPNGIIAGGRLHSVTRFVDEWKADEAVFIHAPTRPEKGQDDYLVVPRDQLETLQRVLEYNSSGIFGKGANFYNLAILSQ